MKAFLEWAGTACAVVAVCSLVHTLTRKTGAGKVYKWMSSAVFVCVLLSPVTQFAKGITLPSITVENNQENKLQDTAIMQMKTMTEGLLLAKVNEALASYDLTAEKIEISMDISENGDISITDIRLFILESPTLHRVWVEQIAEKRLGRSVTVMFVNGG